MLWAMFFIGLLIGANVGLFVLALCFSAGRRGRNDQAK